MENNVASPPSRTRFGLRLQLSLTFGLLIAILAVILASLLIGKAWVRGLVDQNFTEQQLSRFASEIVIQTLLCRRFEKDILLNLDDQVVRSDYLSRWNQATSDLERAIQGFSIAAVTVADRTQADMWRTEIANYRAAIQETLRAIDSGRITTPEEANTVLAPAKDSIRNLMDTAMITVRDKDTAVQSSSDALSGAISRSARMIVLFGLVGLILCSALDRR
jgi:methyl-accepting chemotaxis protein